MAETPQSSDSVPFRILEWFPDLSADVILKLKGIHTELLRFNRRINLIGVNTIHNADCVHFADSISAGRLIRQKMTSSTIYDFGSGNGFPGLVFAATYADIKVVLVDSDTRKVEYLKHCIANVGLTNCSAILSSIESLPDGSVMEAMTRGLASVAKTLLMTRRVVAKGGQMFHLKGEEWATEVTSVPSQLCSFWSPSLLGEYKLPLGNVKFAVVVTEKIAD